MDLTKMSLKWTSLFTKSPNAKQIDNKWFDVENMHIYCIKCLCIIHQTEGKSKCDVYKSSQS